MNRKKTLERRYWIVGILGSLVFHGAILLLPLYSTFTYVENAASPSLRIGLIGLSIPEAMSEISQLPANQGKTEAGADHPISSQEEVSQIQDVFPMEELPALAQEPAPSLLSNCEKDESPVFFEKIADLPDTKQSENYSEDRQSEVIQTSAPQPRALDPEPSELPFVALKTEETAKQEPTIEAIVEAPVIPPRQYFVPSKGELLAQKRNSIGASSTQTVEFADPSVTESDSGHAQAASDEGYLSSAAQVAELKAEKNTLYNKLRYYNMTNSSAQPAQPDLSVPPSQKAQQFALEPASQNIMADSDIEMVKVPKKEKPEKREPMQTRSQPDSDSGLVPLATLSENQGLASTSEVPTIEETFRSPAPDKSPPIQAPFMKEQGAASSDIEPASLYAEDQHFDTAETLSQRIANELSTKKEYPPAALRRKTEGVVKLSLDVAPNGSLIRVKIQTPSGSAILDEAALRLVQSIFPLDIKLASAVSLIVPVEYRIRK